MGKPPGLLLHGAGEMPPSTQTNFLPQLATPPFSAGFVGEASVRNIHMRKNRVELCAPERLSLLSQAAFAGSFADSRHK